MKTSELTGAALDWAVAKCEGREAHMHFDEDGELYASDREYFDYSIDWCLAGLIIEREGITIIRCDDIYGVDSKGFTTTQRIPRWAAEYGKCTANGVYGSQGDYYGQMFEIDESTCSYGHTPLIAAMRAYVASKLGDDIDIPEELK